MNRYLSNLVVTPVNTLKDIVEYNKAHSDIELPQGNNFHSRNAPVLTPLGHTAQDLLEKSVDFGISSEEYEQTLAYARDVGRTKGLDRVFDEYSVDVIIGPAESAITYFSSAAGEPRAVSTFQFET